MNLKDLEYVKAVAHFKHFRKAADACFVSQPTLSGQIKKLEQELGVILFDRSTKHVTLTTQGERLLTQITLILEQTQILKELAATSNQPLQGKLSIGIIPTIAPYLLPTLLTSMKAAFTQSQFSFIEMQTSTILAALDSGEVDFAILAAIAFRWLLNATSSCSSRLSSYFSTRRSVSRPSTLHWRRERRFPGCAVLDRLRLPA